MVNTLLNETKYFTNLCLIPFNFVFVIYILYCNFLTYKFYIRFVLHSNCLTFMAISRPK